MALNPQVRAVVIAIHFDPVCSVFGGNPQEGRQELGPNALEPDQANPSHSIAVDQLWPEWRGKKSSQYIGVHLEVDQDSSVDHAMNYGNLHNCLLNRLTANTECD